MVRKLHASVFLFLLSTWICGVAIAQQRPELKGAKGTILSGTLLNVRIIESLTSESAQVGDVFHGTLLDDLEVNGKVLFPRGSDVTGRVVDAQSSGRLSAPGILELTLTSIQVSNVSAKLITEPLKIEGESHTKSNATKIGAGAAAGAIIGAIAGGGKGAAIGTVVGGAAGTGAAAASGKREAKVDSEAVLSWTTTVDVLTTPVAASTASAGSSEVRSYNDDVHLTPRGAAAKTAPAEPAKPSGPATPGTVATADFAPEFSARDRRVLRTCLTGDTGDLPPGLAKKEQLPAGAEKQLQKNGTLPPGLAKRAQALPLACESQLPRLPSTVERVILNRQIILLGSHNRILDVFDIDEQ